MSRTGRGRDQGSGANVGRGSNKAGIDSKAIEKAAKTTAGGTLGSAAEDAAARFRSARVSVDRLIARVRSLETK